MTEKVRQSVTLFVRVRFWQDDYEAKWQIEYDQMVMIVSMQNEYEQRFREAFFSVVLPWINLTFRGTNERRERLFVRDWVGERFLWALEERTIFRRWDFVNACFVTVVVPVSIAWYDDVWRFDNNGGDTTFIIVQNSSEILRWFSWWRLEYEWRYECPHYAVTRWLYDIYARHYKGSILVLPDQKINF